MTLRASRLRSQRLTGDRPGDVHDVVAHMTALQAQDTPASRLAIRPRSSGLDATAVRRACDEERSVVRTWLLRRTLHMVAAEDVRWLLGLLGPPFAAAGRGRRAQLGLDDDTCARGLTALRTVLAHGPLTRAAVVDRLVAHGVALDPRSQAPAHLVGYAALRGLICRGPDVGRDEPTYVLLDDWVPARLSHQPDDPLAELARRYLIGHGPAEPEDLAAWAGIGLRQARRAFASVTLPEARAASEPRARLLPAFDAYLLAYRDRAFALDSRDARQVQAGGGWIHPVVVVDGRVVATWRQERRPDGIRVSVRPFDGLDGDVRRGLEAEVADLGRFLGSPAALGD